MQLINLIFVLCSTVRAHLSFSLVTRTHIQNSSFEMVQLQVLINSWHICLVCVVECNLLKCYYSQGGSSSYLECCRDFFIRNLYSPKCSPSNLSYLFFFNLLINLCFYLLQTSSGKNIMSKIRNAFKNIYSLKSLCFVLNYIPISYYTGGILSLDESLKHLRGLENVNRVTINIVVSRNWWVTILGEPPFKFV